MLEVCLSVYSTRGQEKMSVPMSSGLTVLQGWPASNHKWERKYPLNFFFSSAKNFAKERYWKVMKLDLFLTKQHQITIHVTYTYSLPEFVTVRKHCSWKKYKWFRGIKQLLTISLDLSLKKNPHLLMFRTHTCKGKKKREKSHLRRLFVTCSLCS